MTNTTTTDQDSQTSTAAVNLEIFERSGFSPWMRDNIYTVGAAHIKALTVEDFKVLMGTIEACRKAGAPFEYVGISLAMPAKPSENNEGSTAPAPKLTRNEYKAVALCGIWKTMQAEIPELPRMSFKGEKEEFKQAVAKKPNRSKNDQNTTKPKKRPMRILTDSPFAALAALKKK